MRQARTPPRFGISRREGYPRWRPTSKHFDARSKQPVSILSPRSVAEVGSSYRNKPQADWAGAHPVIQCDPRLDLEGSMLGGSGKSPLAQAFRPMRPICQKINRIEDTHMALVKSAYFRERAEESAQAATSATLENVRVRSRHSESVWRELGDRAAAHEAEHKKLAAEKAARDEDRT